MQETMQSPHAQSTLISKNEIYIVTNFCFGELCEPEEPDLFSRVLNPVFL